ncbi:ESPR-type extended signal peptide-containing protein [Luteimonas sp. A277]
MNKIYSKVWNKELGQLVVASEFARSDSTGVVQGAGAATLLRRSLLAAVLAPALALAGLAGLAGSTAFAQDASWTVSNGDTITFQGDDNINVNLTGANDDATLAITLDPDLVVDSVTASTVTTGSTVMNNSGVAVGGNVMLGSTGLTITGGPSVTLDGINAGNRVITGVLAGEVATDAVNVGQLDAVNTVAAAAQAAAAQNTADITTNINAISTNTADIATNAADIAANTAEIDDVRSSATAGWNISAEGGPSANVGSGGSVDFSGDGNIEVSQAGTNLAFSLADEIEVGSIGVGGMTLDADGIDVNGKVITGLAHGNIALDSTEAVTGHQLHNALFEGGTAFGVRYFRVNSEEEDSRPLGEESIAIGPDTEAAGDSSFAAGDGAATTETAEGAIALGQGATAGTEDAVDGDGSGSIAIGRGSQAAGNSTVALGDGASVESEYVENATAVGAGARVTGNFGTGGTAVGANANASAANATALGTDAHASGSGSIAVGQANATAGNAIAAGTGAYVGTGDSIALGTGAGVGTEDTPGGDRTDHIAIGTAAGQDVVGNQSTAIGYGAGQSVIGDGNVALGVEAGRGLTGNNNISIGVNANDGAGGRAQAIAIGDATEAGSDSVALGSGARAAGSETLALGKDSSAGANGVALGAHADAEGSNIALGRNSAARESDLIGTGYLTGEAVPGSAVSVGNSNPGEAFQRRITNLADGSQRYDAVNVGQLQGAQQAVANLVGGSVTVESNGSFGGYVIELQDQDGISHQYTTVAEAINAVSSGAINVLPGDAVIYNPNGTVTVAQGVVGTDAVNVEQLNEAVAESGVKYYSANTTVDANRDNDGATADDAMAIGPAAVASGSSSLAIGHAARVNAGAHNGVAIGHDVSARAENATVLGNRSHSYDAGGVAIGQQAVSRGQNSIVMGTGAEADPKSGDTVDNAIVIGTVAEATADDGIAIGQSALASEERAVAQGYDAHAMATDSQAFGTRARTTGVNSQASGTDAHASGTNAIATGTNSRGYATDGIAMGTGAISGFVVDIPGDDARNHGSIAIGDTSRADDLNAMALGVEAQARAESATAIGDSAVATESAEDGLAVGSSARVTAQNASAFGRGAEAVAEDALAVGSGARASGQNASAVGRGAEASAENASAFGQGARAMHQGSVALGSGAETAAAVGTASYTVDRNTYNFAGTNPVATVSVGTPGAERTITNVAAGRISATSTDAINGSQLYGTNQAVDALADDLDTAGQSVAAALGGTSAYDPVTHNVTAGLSVQGNSYTNVQDALTYVGQGWNVSAESGASANVAPGGSVNFSSDDGNIDISRNGTDLVFDLSDDLEIGNSITVGGTTIDGDQITTNNLTVGGETRLGDNFVVNNAGDVTYNGSEIATQNDGLSFAGNTGGTIDKTLGDNTPLTISGDLAATEASTGANLRVDSDGNQLNLVMARDLTDLDSITINNGPVINGSGIDMGDTRITNLAPGQDGTDAVNVDQLEAVSETANAGWNVSVDGEGAVADNNVGPSGTVDFSNTDGNIEISRDGTDLAFNLADDLEIGNSITVDGNTTIDGTGVGVGTDVHLGDTGLVINGGPSVTTAGIDAGGTVITNVGPGVDGTDAVNVDQLNTLANTPLTFAGDAGADVDRRLGETVSLIGGADESALTDGNIGVVADGTDTLEIKLNKDIDLGEDGSLAIGDSELDNDGLAVNDGAGNSTAVGAGSIEVTEGGYTTTIGGTAVSIGGDNPILISGDTGTIGGLTNQTIDYPEFADGTGRAATEEQLGLVNQTATAGWNLSGSGADEVNIGPNGSVDFQGDQNITVAQTGDDQEGVIGVTLNRDLDVDSVTAGDTVVDGTGVGVGDDVHLGDTGLVIGDADGPRFTNDGISAGGQVITNVAPGVDGTDAVNVDQLTGLANTPLTFAGDAGTDVDRLLGETVNLVGGATDEVALTEGNIGVVANGDDTLEIKLNKDIDLGEDGSLAIGDTLVDTDGLAVTDDDGNVTMVAADGTTVEDDAGNVTTVAAGNVTVTDGDGSTSIGAGVVTVAGTSSTITIDGDAGMIGGLTNTTFDPNATYTGGVAATQEQLSQVNTDLTSAGLNFVGDDGQVVHRDLGDELSITGGADLNALAEGNIGVTRNVDEDGLVIELADNIELTEDGSLAIGDGTDGSTLDADGLTVVDGDNSTVVEAGTISVTDGTAETVIGSNQVSVGGDNPILISGDTGTIGGLTNLTFDPDNIVSGQAATEDQLGNVYDVANAGWDVSAQGGNATNVGVNSPTGNTVDLNNADGNIVVTKADDSNDVTFDLSDELEIGTSITVGDTFIDGDSITTTNLTVDGVTQLGDHFTVNDNGVYYEGPITEGDHIVNKTYVDGAVDDLANTPLTFAGDAGTDVERRLGETVNLVGGAADEAALTEGNIGVVADGSDTLEIKLNKDIDLGADGSVAIGNTTVNNAGLTVAVATGSTTVGAGFVSVEGAGGTIMIDGNTGTIGGLTNTTFDPDSYTSGQAATEDQLKQVSDVANAGWNVSVEGEGAVADNNVGPGGTVDFSNTDGNIDIGRDGTDLVFDLADDITVDSVTAGDTFIDTTGVAVGTDVHLGNTGLVITGGPSVTITGINAGNMVITNVAPGEISATSTDAINGSQLHGMGDSITTIIGGNAELNPDGTITTSDIGGTGHDNIDDAIRSANDAANAGWTATDADGNAANIGPNGSVNFTGDGNISVAQTGDDNSGEIEITLNRDLDVDSITAGNTVIDTDGVRVGDDVHLGDTGLVIEGGPSVTTDGIDAGGSVITNVAAGVNDTDAANVGQLNQVAGDVNDLGDRMDVVEGDVSDLQAGATGPFQVSQEAPIVAPTPTGANSAAGGSGADASGDNSTALGNQAVASGANSTAVGQGAQATHDNSVALGQGSATTVGAQSGYDAAYVGSSSSSGEVNVGNRTISGVAPGVAGNDAVNVNQLNAGVNHAVVTANDYTDQRINQVQGDVWHLHGRVDDLEKSINSGVATAMAMRQAPYVAGATTYFAGFGAYKDQGALGVSLRRTADNGRWSLEGGFSANRDGAGGYVGVSGVLGSK